MEVTDFKNIILDYTRKIAESMNTAFCPLVEEYGLTMMQARILMELYNCENHTIGSLAESTCAAGANISAMCKKLEGQGLLERVRYKKDERVVKVVLTEEGKEKVMNINRAFNEKFSKDLANEAEETFDDIILGLQKLNDLLQKICRS